VLNGVVAGVEVEPRHTRESAYPGEFGKKQT
jgi:hypothetical protein